MHPEPNQHWKQDTPRYFARMDRVDYLRLFALLLLSLTCVKGVKRQNIVKKGTTTGPGWTRKEGRGEPLRFKNSSTAPVNDEEAKMVSED